MIGSLHDRRQRSRQLPSVIVLLGTPSAPVDCMEPELMPRTPESAEPASTGCCPRFDPEPWQERELVWRDKPFVKSHVRSVLHVPVGVARMYARETANIEQAGAKESEGIVLCDESSRWGTDYFFAVSKEQVSGASMVHLSGTFLTRVYEGRYREAGKWMRDMAAHVDARGKRLERIFSWYTTCPRCARAYGANYVVLFAQVASE